MARITGIGGIFIKSPDPKGLGAWYRDKLGIAIEDWGGAIIQRDTTSPAYTIWSPFAESTQHFAPSSRDAMFNFVVDDLDAYLKQIESAGVKVIDRTEDEMQGKFAWVLDPDGTKLEFWQPKT